MDGAAGSGSRKRQIPRSAMRRCWHTRNRRRMWQSFGIVAHAESKPERGLPIRKKTKKPGFMYSCKDAKELAELEEDAM